MVLTLAVLSMNVYAFGDPTATPSPVPTPTCPPCDPIIRAEIISLDDTLGDCTDTDGNLDAGETCDVLVGFISYESACITEQHSADITVDNPKISIKPSHVNLDLEGTLIDFTIVADPDIACNESVTITIETHALFCGSFYHYQNQYTFQLEIDITGEEWTCDDTPCGEPQSIATPFPHGMNLLMPDRDLAAGDRLELTAVVSNVSSDPMNADCWIALSSGDCFWFYPSWRSIDAGVDFIPWVQVAPFNSQVYSILNFEWPAGAGSGDDLRFLAIAIDHVNSDVIGSIRIIEWQYQ